MGGEELSKCSTMYCIPLVVTISAIAILGIVGNLLVIGIVLYNPKFHKVTFVALAALATADETFLLSRYIRFIFRGYWLDTAKQFPTITYILDFFSLTGAGASITLVVLLSVMRYCMIVHPIKTKIWLTIKKTVVISLCVWLACALQGGIYLFAVIINKTNADLRRYTNWVITLLMSVVPIILLLTFHVLKANKLLHTLSGRNKGTVVKMSRVITMVCVCFLLTTMPSNIMDCLILSQSNLTRERDFIHFAQVCRVLLYINYSINPFIYVLHHPNMFRCFTALHRPRSKVSYSLTSSM